MSPGRRSRIATTATPLPEGPAVLLRKYQELLAQHERLVHTLQLRGEEQLSTHRLSTWALETSESALALLSDGVVLLANRRWHELDRGGPWHRVQQGRQQGPAFKTLRQLAEAAALSLSVPGNTAPQVERYQEKSGRRTVELRTERVGSPRRAPSKRAVRVRAHDITAQVRAEQELEQARAALTEQEHLRALSELSSGVAHDLHSTVGAMKLRLEMLGHDTEFAARNRAHLDALLRIVSDAATRIRRLEDFARQQQAVELARSAAQSSPPAFPE
jgi:signal transduction histidine kinase